MTASATKLDQILAYAARGWRVLPLHYPIELEDGAIGCSCERPPCSIGKHPMTTHGLLDATVDTATIAGWFKQDPACGWGVATGAASGVVVLDVDPRHGGDESLHDLEQRYGTLPSTIITLTGSGGAHYWFKHPGGKVSNSAGILGSGLDIRGDGGYVVVPPSMHLLRKAYRWDEGHRPDGPAAAELAILPRWIAQPEYEHVYQVSGFEAPVRIPEGERDNTLTQMAGVLRYAAFETPGIEAALHVANQQRCDPPLPDTDIRRIAWSIGRKPPWETPGPTLETGTPEPKFQSVALDALEPFPLAALPTVLQDFASHWARALHSVPEIIAIPCLAFASGAIGITKTVRLNSRHSETAMLWTGIIGEPGSAKSPAIAESGRWLYPRDAEMYAKWESDMDDYRWRMSQLKKGERPTEPPARQQRVAKDMTTEALGKILHGDNHGLINAQDELGSWI